MTHTYYSDRERGIEPRLNEIITLPVWKGISSIVEKLIGNGSFGISYPALCSDNSGVSGTDAHAFANVIQAEIPDLFSSDHLIDDCYVQLTQIFTKIPENTNAIFDLIEFCYMHVAKPIQKDWHNFYRHYHLGFDRVSGQNEFRETINRIFARNGLIFEINKEGKIIRLTSPVLHELIKETIFSTEDKELDSILDSACTKFFNTDVQIRRESLEKLWDAWERIKTIEPARDKRESTKLILDKAADKQNSFREVLENEARELTRIGNEFQIRHSETNKEPIKNNKHIDYLFHRLFSLINLVLNSR